MARRDGSELHKRLSKSKPCLLQEHEQRIPLLQPDFTKILRLLPPPFGFFAKYAYLFPQFWTWSVCLHEPAQLLIRYTSTTWHCCPSLSVGTACSLTLCCKRQSPIPCSSLGLPQQLHTRQALDRAAGEQLPPAATPTTGNCPPIPCLCCCTGTHTWLHRQLGRTHWCCCSHGYWAVSLPAVCLFPASPCVGCSARGPGGQCSASNCSCGGGWGGWRDSCSSCNISRQPRGVCCSSSS
jgi:hypothetical protein